MAWHNIIENINRGFYTIPLLNLISKRDYIVTLISMARFMLVQLLKLGCWLQYMFHAFGMWSAIIP